MNFKSVSGRIFISVFCLSLIFITGCVTSRHTDLDISDIDLLPDEQAIAFLNEEQHFSDCTYTTHGVAARNKSGQPVVQPYENLYYRAWKGSSGWNMFVHTWAKVSTPDVSCLTFYAHFTAPQTFHRTVKGNWRSITDDEEVKKIIAALRSLGVRPYKR